MLHKFLLCSSYIYLPQTPTESERETNHRSGVKKTESEPSHSSTSVDPAVLLQDARRSVNYNSDRLSFHQSWTRYLSGARRINPPIGLLHFSSFAQCSCGEKKLSGASSSHTGLAALLRHILQIHDSSKSKFDSKWNIHSRLQTGSLTVENGIGA